VTDDGSASGYRTFAATTSTLGYADLLRRVANRSTGLLHRTRNRPWRSTLTTGDPWCNPRQAVAAGWPLIVTRESE